MAIAEEPQIVTVQQRSYLRLFRSEVGVSLASDSLSAVLERS
jgi:hypothetical protein